VFTNLSGAVINLKDVVGIWLFEGKGDEVKESRGMGLDGEIKGSTKRVKGRFGNALEFDGATSVEIPDHDDLRLGKAQTICVWLYPTDDVGDWVRVVGKGASDPRNYGLWRQSDGDLLYQIYPGCNSWQDGNAATNAPTKKWTHEAGTYDGKNMKLFLNGVELVSAACSTVPATSPDPLTFGFAGFHTYFKGIIDEVVIIEAVLTGADIKKIADEGIEKATGIDAVSPKGKLATSWGQIKNQ